MAPSFSPCKCSTSLGSPYFIRASLHPVVSHLCGASMLSVYVYGCDAQVKQGLGTF